MHHLTHRTFWIGLSLSIMFSACLTTCLFAQQRAKATADQESRMLGMIVGAVEDLYGGFLGEARGRFQRIMSELEKRDYSAQLRWMAYDEFGKFLLKTGDAKGAIKALSRSQEEARGLTAREMAKSTFDLAFVYAQTGDTAAAINEYKAALALDPQNYDVMLELGSMYRRAKLFKEARELYERIIAGNPKYAEAYGNLGNVYVDQGDIESAVVNYEKFAFLSANKDLAAQNFLNAGFEYAARGEYEKALPLYLRALELTPANPLAYADIGWSKLKLGKTQESIDAFEKALKLKPTKQVQEYARKGLEEARARKR